MGSHPSERRVFAFLEEHKPEFVIGVDEVAYGAFGGGLYVAAYVAKTNANLDVKDSKLYGSRKKLDEAALRLMSEDRNWYLVHRVSVETLNRLGLGAALKEAFAVVVEKACQSVENAVVIVDGIRTIQAPVPVLAVPKADRFVPQVSAASVVAKHHQLIESDVLDELYPQYGFRDHHGYGTPVHRKAIKVHGLTKEHRTYIRVIRELIENGEKKTIE